MKYIFKFFRRRCKKWVETIYDSEDNVIKINGTWYRSWDLNNNRSGNPIIGVTHDYARSLFIIDLCGRHNLERVKINGRNIPFQIISNRVTISYPDMHFWINHSGVFYIDLIFKP